MDLRQHAYKAQELFPCFGGNKWNTKQSTENIASAQPIGNSENCK